MAQTESMQTPRDALTLMADGANADAIRNLIPAVAAKVPALRALASQPEEERIAAGYGHTLREILQQPALWADTAVKAMEFVHRHIRPLWAAGMFRSVAITGSGSSHYVAELVAPALQGALGMPVASIPAGDLLTHGSLVLPLPRPVLLISIARSGNSPESLAAVRVVRDEAPDSYFLNITCNAKGKLAAADDSQGRTHRLVLHPLANDESLVMTSSFTCLSLGALSLASVVWPEGYASMAAQLCMHGSTETAAWASTAAGLPFADCHRAVFLGNGCQYGASREAALKLTEMTAGRIVSMAETYLGLRHGPMAAIHSDTLVVCFEPPLERSKRYADDLIRELERKNLGLTILRSRAQQPVSAPAGVEARVDANLSEASAAIGNVVAGQWVGFFACRFLGLHPDAPSEGGVITRVVEPFPLYH